MKNLKNKIKNNKAAVIVFLILILLTFLTQFYGSTDINDYSNTAKFFAGKYSAKIRNSHSYLLGFLHSPFVWITNNFIIFKITSLIFLALIIYSVYIINKKDKKTFWLMLLSPIVWYMAPWINPIQLAGLLLLWAYYFIEKYNYTDKIKYLFYSGIFIGLGWAIWDTIFYFGFILAFVFLSNKKLSHSIYFILFLLIGLMPRLILDQFLFNFPFYSMLKSTLGGIARIFGGVYGEGWQHSKISFFNIFSLILAIPIYYWTLYKPSIFKKNKKTMIFLSLCLIIIFTLPQIRYIIALAPIMIVLIAREINRRQFKKQILFSVFVIFLFISPYLIQINHSVNNKINGVEFTYLFENIFNVQLDDKFPQDIVREDLQEIIKDYSNETFVVGNAPDDYRTLANLYWGKDIREFVSIQDYNLVLKNKTSLYEKKFMPIPNIKTRRQIWLAGGMGKNENDNTDYENINFGIGVNEPINITGFVVIKKYKILYLSKNYKNLND